MLILYLIILYSLFITVNLFVNKLRIKVRKERGLARIICMLNANGKLVVRNNKFIPKIVCVQKVISKKMKEATDKSSRKTEEVKSNPSSYLKELFIYKVIQEISDVWTTMVLSVRIIR